MDVTAVISDLLASNRGPDPLSPENRTQPDYGVHAVLDGDVLRMTLTFQSESAYCCMEWGCHLSLHDGKRWETLRQKCANRGVSTPARFQLQLSCVVETGALFFDMSRPDPNRRGWYTFRPAEAHEYQISSTEGCDTSDG
jgi:hypothetical protein